MNEPWTYFFGWSADEWLVVRRACLERDISPRLLVVKLETLEQVVHTALREGPKNG